MEMCFFAVYVLTTPTMGPRRTGYTLASDNGRIMESR